MSEEEDILKEIELKLGSKKHSGFNKKYFWIILIMAFIILLVLGFSLGYLFPVVKSVNYPSGCKEITSEKFGIIGNACPDRISIMTNTPSVKTFRRLTLWI